MITRRAHHASLTVSDLERSRAFFGDLLGLEEIERPDFGFPGVWYQAGDIQLHLMVAPASTDTAGKPDKPNPLGGHLAFEVEDYEAVCATLEAAGLEVMGLGKEVGQMFVQDPDGNTLEFIQPGGRLGRRPTSDS